MEKNFKSIVGDLVKFSIPLILSGILQQLYNWVDAFILGNVEGELALGAIGGTGTITSFYVFTVTGFNIGIAVFVGQKFGAKETKDIHRILSCFSVVLGGCYLVLAALGIVFHHTFLELIHTPSDTIALAGTYLAIIMVGIPFLAVYNVFSAALRGIGDSRAPFLSILVSSGVNVVLDILLVAVLHLGIAGAAAATIFSQITMTIFLIIYAMKKYEILRFRFGKGLVEAGIFRQGMRLGIPPMIQSCVTACGNLLLQNFMNSFGTATVIAITTSYRVDTLALLPITNFASAISTFTAQSFGAKDWKKTRQIRIAGILTMSVVSILLTILIIPFGSRIVAIFGAGEEAVLISQRFFVRLASFYLIFGLFAAMRGYLEGIGDVMFSSMIGIIILCTRVVLSYAFPTQFGNMIIAYAEAVSWVLGLVLFYVRMRVMNKRSYEVAA